MNLDMNLFKYNYFFSFSCSFTLILLLNPRHQVNKLTSFFGKQCVYGSSVTTIHICKHQKFLQLDNMIFIMVSGSELMTTDGGLL